MIKAISRNQQRKSFH